MREIKFRAWHIPTKKMFDVYSWGKHIIFEISDDGVGTSPTLPAERDDCILMQYTGLKDRNGKDIYEGDILEMRNVGWKYTLVKFHNGKFAFYTTETNYLIPMIGQYWEEGKIIGNIYENPELL